MFFRGSSLNIRGASRVCRYIMGQILRLLLFVGVLQEVEFSNEVVNNFDF